jgi:hypothetical protein
MTSHKFKVHVVWLLSQYDEWSTGGGQMTRSYI